MRFDQPSGQEPSPDSTFQRNIPYRRQPEPFRGSLAADRFDWVEPFEPLVRNKQTWFVVACLVFALSPLALWTLASFDNSAKSTSAAQGSAPEGPTRPAAGIANVEDDPQRETSSTTQEAVGPSARFGGETAGSSDSDRSSTTDADGEDDADTATSGTGPSGSSTSTTPASILESIGGPIIEHPLTTVFIGDSPADDSTSDENEARTTTSHSGPCHPDYSGCVPMVLDVDCADSGEDGPIFVTGPILVTGDDVYQIDPNGDQIACFDGDNFDG